MIVSNEVARRMAVERRIARQAIRDLLAAGYLISVNDGGATVLTRSISQKAILAAMFSTDEDVLLAYRAVDGDKKGSFGWIRFVYGNDGWDVINDYTINLDPVLASTNALIDLEGRR